MVRQKMIPIQKIFLKNCLFLLWFFHATMPIFFAKNVSKPNFLIQMIVLQNLFIVFLIGNFSFHCPLNLPALMCK